MVQHVLTKDYAKQAMYLYKKFQHEGDSIRCEKIKQLANKFNNEEKVIAFCGHFSAGKSSMINKIVGEDVLPSSPIPTSANLVKVFKGKESYAKVNFHDGKALKYLAPYNIHEIKNYSKDGEKIHSLEISSSNSTLPKQTVVMDTPGIDSTDEAHKLATESALYLADLVVYVMDYNHVQSEQNFLFTKEMVDQKKRLILVINQIDKHNEKELSFNQFKQSVIDSFASWGVRPDRIFYTSLKKDDHPQNEYDNFVKYLEERMAKLNVETSFESSLQMLIEEHIQWKYEQWEEKKSLLENRIMENGVDDIDSYIHEREQYQRKQKELEQYFNEELQAILKNAYLMPFQTRELARLFLESTQPNFKVGMFFAKKKTEEVKRERFSNLLNDLKEKLDSQIHWHIKELLLTIYRSLQLQHPITKEIEYFTIELNEKDLLSLVKKGAQVNGDYVLNYTNDLADVIKKLARNKANDLFQRMMNEFLHLSNEKFEKIDQQYFLANELKEEMKLLLSEKENIQTYKEEILLSLNLGKINIQDEEIHRLFKEWKQQKDITIIESSFSSIDFDKPKVEQTEQYENIELQNEKVYDIDEEQVISTLKEAVKHLSTIPTFKQIVQQLKEKTDRLEQRSFTVALFGAFSAGKSSFANALMGQYVLPVSPNPTTASINKILPPTSEFKHGTARIKLKSREMIFADINDALSKFDVQSSNFQDSFEKIQQVLDTKQVNQKNKAYFSFLKAFLSGYPNVENHLNETIIAGLDEFQQFVAKEEKSCFVEWIELYYDCPLTQMGITLVDTPGADSINARHTGVAFEYIKHSDAILYVTYYNHAFSKADREFLIQLGRVKDIFELDKMFFIVNAIDLANSEEELQGVLSYVREQLLQYGIRNANLFPVSSLLAIKEKETNERLGSQIDAFENAFHRFIRNDLLHISVEKAKEEFYRALNRLQTMLEEAKMDEGSKQRRIKAITEEKDQALEIIGQSTSHTIQNQLNQEIEELTFYIKQRVFYRFQDFFKESFNPSILKGSRNEMKEVLMEALKELIQSLSFDLAQEMRATTLRVETFMNKRLFEWRDILTDQLEKINPQLSFSMIELPNIQTPEFNELWDYLDIARFKKAMSLYRNAKSFFEADEKTLMKEELEKQLNEPVTKYIQSQKKLLILSFEQNLQSHFEHITHQLLNEVEDFYESSLLALNQMLQIDELEKIYETLKQQSI